MERIYSKVQPDLLLHVIFRFQDFNAPRTEVLESHNFLQSSAIRGNEGMTFRPHRHIEKVVSREHEVTQECQVIIRGVIECSLFDIDDTLLEEKRLKEGDAFYTLRGGHGFKILEDDTCILEFKSSPYEGQSRDKIFIDE
jgi:hypothetical protein